MKARVSTDEGPGDQYCRWRAALSAILLFACAIVAGCAQQEPTPLRVGSIVWPGYEPLFVARHLGYLDPKNVSLLEYTSTTQVLSAYNNGTIDAGCMTLDEALLLAQEAPDVRVVLVFDISNGADVIMARPEITGLKALKGRRVGAETTALGAYVLTRALQIAGLDRGEVTIVPLEASEQEAGFKQGEVDAVVTFEPTKTKLREFGARKIFDSTQIPGEIVDVLVVRQSYLLAHADAVAHLIQGWYRGLDYLKTRPLDAARIAAARVHTTPEEFLASLDGLVLPDSKEARRLLVGRAPPLLRTAETLSSVMTAQSLLRRKVDARNLLEQRVLERVLP